MIKPKKKERFIPCDCPKGGIIENFDGEDYPCPKCGGTEWIDTKKKAKPTERKGIEKIEVDTMNIIEGSTGKELWGFASKKDIEKIICQLGELVDAVNNKK